MSLRRPKRSATVADLRGPATLRSGLVGNNSRSKDKTSTDRYGSCGLDGLEPCEVIGEGKYGVVHKMLEQNTGQMRVVKTVERPSGWDEGQLRLEAELLQNLDHPHILRIFSWYEDGDAVNIVMEHCEGGELMKAVKEGRNRDQRLPEMWAATCIRQSFEALVYIHSKGIVHKDLKSANLLLMQSTEFNGKMFYHAPHVVVCDLGLAEVCGRGGMFGIGGVGRAKRVAGTPVTMAPEVWKGSFGPKSDVWSMGCVTFEMLAGRLPFRPEKNEESAWAELHRKGPDWDVFFDNAISREALRFCESLLTVKESARPSAVEVLDHEWLKKSHKKGLTPEELDGFLNAVRTWKSRNPMQRALSLKMAAGCTCLKKFASLFSEFDTDNSGILDQAELVPAMESAGFNKEQAHEIALSLDVNNDGSCEYLEFAAACLSSLEEEFDELLRQEFNVLDVERKTWLTDKQMNSLIDELRPLALQHGITVAEVDANGDGVISFAEFFEYFGRPGSEYISPNVSVEKKPDRVKQLPMKQHIRIVREECLESYISAMHASIEMSKHSGGSRGLSGSGNHSPHSPSSPKEFTGDDAEQDGPPEESPDPVADRILSRMLARTKLVSKSSKDTLDAPGPEAHAAEAVPVESAVDSKSTAATMADKRKADAKAVDSDPAGIDAQPNESHSSCKLSLGHDSERNASRDQKDSHQSHHSTGSENRQACLGCWLTDGPLKWFGIQGHPVIESACTRAAARPWHIRAL